ncbi:MAG: FIST N-terminal domain-containing protein [Patescibacteria group bacterium]
MKIEQKKWTPEGGWKTLSKEALPAVPQLVLVFGGSALVKEEKTFAEVKELYPASHIAMMSTAGEIFDTSVSDGTLSLTAIHFEKTTVECVELDVADAPDSKILGEKLAQSLLKENLVHVMVYSDGLKVNGASLVEGVTGILPPAVALTGGLVGDGSDFKHTYVGLDHVPAEGKIVGIGFYGDSLTVSYGSMGGWDPFGPERIITKAKDNVLYELDGKPALSIYKEYLGEEKAKELPSSGLLFPLNLRLKTKDGETPVVRTILGVNEADQSMTFAGTMPEGISAQLMKANFERLISGASGAANMIKETKSEAQLALLISCVGRKLVLKERIEEETEAIREVFGPDVALAGFYSYGEISPNAPTANQCQLHNQTMTITTFAEK